MPRFAFILVLCSLSALSAKAQSEPPKTAEKDFEEKARKLARQERLKVEPTVLTPAKRPSASNPWHPNMVTTVFWVGEGGSQKSAWDPEWEKHYGGSDQPDPAKRRKYLPIGFIPQLNPFYCALPYNDLVGGQFKPEAPLVIPWFKSACQEPGKSVCQNHWVAIRKQKAECDGGGQVICYAQWSDCGPFAANDFQYVFGTERPRPNANHGSGLNVSPAVRDFLGLSSTDITDWQFVEVRDVPPGPWRSYGSNNHFVLSRRQQDMIAPDFHRLPTDVRF